MKRGVEEVGPRRLASRPAPAECPPRQLWDGRARGGHKGGCGTRRRAGGGGCSGRFHPEVAFRTYWVPRCRCGDRDDRKGAMPPAPPRQTSLQAAVEVGAPG